MLEKEIEKKVCDYAKQHGFLVYKFSSPNHVGVPDRLFIAPHQHAFWIEFKREGGKPTPAQERECLKLRRCGFDVYLVDSVEFGIEVIDGEMETASDKIQAYIMGKKVSALLDQAEAAGQTRQ